MASIPLQSNILGASPIPNVKEDFLAGFSKVKKEQKPKGLKTFEETGMTVDDMLRKGLITTSEAMDRGLVNYTTATDEQMKPSYQMEAPKAPLQEGLVGKGLRALSKGPPAVNIPQKIAEPITGFIQSGQQELESRKQTRLEETDMKISQTIDELASEGYSEDQIMEVFADLDKEGFFKDKPGVIEGMSQRLYSSLSEGVSRGQKASEVAQQNIAGESPITAGEISLAGGANVLSTAVSAPFNAVFGGVIEAGMEKLPEPVKQKIVEAGEMYDQFAKENPRAGFNLRTAGDVATFAPIPLAPIVTQPVKKYGEKVIKETITKTQESMASLKKGLQKKNAEKMKRMTDEGLEEIYQAVNPTTRENKAVLRQRVEDLLPYIDETKRFSNDLPTVKGRVDADKIKAFKDMEDYETNVGVKGQVDTDLVAKSIENKYMEKIGDSFINKTEAEIAKDLIDTLKGFGKVVKDADIVKIRRAWDKIIEKNKGFMQSADATSKGDIFADANKFFRDEIKKSNPEYAKYLEKAHKTITLSDILDATIQRRTGQSQGGFLRQGLENVARVAGTGIGAGVGTMVGSPAVGAMLGYGATEVLMEGVKKATGSSAKLTKGKKLLLKSKKNDSNTSNNPNSRTRPMEGEQGQKPSRSGLERKIPIEKKKPFSTKMEGVDYERIPGSKKMAKEYPYGKTVRLGEKEKKGVEVKGTPLIPAQSQTSQLARQKEIKSIKSSIASATKSAQFGGTGNMRVESQINNLLSEKKITRDEALRILSDIQKSVDSGSNEFAYMNKGKLADYISEIKGGKKVVDEFDELLNKKPETKTPIVEKKTDKQIYDRLQEIANDGRFGEKSWNTLAKEFKKQTGVDVMDVTFDDFSEMGVLTKKKTGIQKKKGIVTPDKSENSPIAKKKGISAKMAENDQKGEKFRTAEDMNKAELTTKILKGLGDRDTVSKEFIRNMTNSGDVKQVEKDIIRGLLESEGDKVNVADFKKKVQAELLPLKASNPETRTKKYNYLKKEFDSVEKEIQDFYRNNPRSDNATANEKMQKELSILFEKKDSLYEKMRRSNPGSNRYERVSLPSETRGKVKDYRENIYESPIKTSAGSVHFSGDTKNYFGHTRVEDMADNTTRRVIEVQSDLFQKGRLEQEGKFAKNLRKNPEWFNASEEMVKEVEKDFAKLSQYNDPTAHFRMIREEVAKAVEDGKTKLQFPTGETAMKIEGLGSTKSWFTKGEESLNDSTMKIGQEIYDRQGSRSLWVITEVSGDGKFKAVPKDYIDSHKTKFGLKDDKEALSDLLKMNDGRGASAIETFDISGKVDQNNPIYKFYEKEVGRYLKNKYDAKLVTDDKGVSWMQIDLKESMGGPVEAFRKGGIIPKSQMTDAQKMEITDLNQRFFGDDSLQIVDKIVSNEKALGSYRNGMIKIVDGQVNPTDTFYHESVHKYLDVFTTKDEAKAILEHGKAKYKDGDYVSVEEKIAEDFIKFAKDRSGVTGKVRIIFENILDRIKTYFGKGDKISQMYRDILKGKAKGKGIQPKGKGLKYRNEDQLEYSKFAKEKGLSFDYEDAGGEKRIIIDLFPDESIKGKGITTNETINAFKKAFDRGNTIVEPSNGMWTKEGYGFIKSLENKGYIKSIPNRGGIIRFQVLPKVKEYDQPSKLENIYKSTIKKPIQRKS